MAESSIIKECWIQYEIASGQQVNFQKSSILFSSNTREDRKVEVCNVLDVYITNDHGIYLGLPSLIGRNKKAIFSFIKERLWHRIQSWHSKSLSRAGKEILIKTIA